MSTVSQATDAIYNRLHSTSQTPLYHPSSADLFTDWNYEAGDVISIKSDNTSYKTPLYKTQLKWTGAPKLTVTASGNKERDKIVEMKRREYASSTSNYSNQKSLRGGMGAAQSGVKEIDGRLYQAGLSVDPVTGLFMYQTVQGDGFALGASLKIQDGKINAKADSTVVDALGTRVGNAEISIDGINSEIKLKASKETVDALGERVSTAESSLTVQAEQIESKVSTTDFNGNEIASRINQTATTITIQAQKIDLQGYVTASQLEAAFSEATLVSTQRLSVANSFYINGAYASWQSTNVVLSAWANKSSQRAFALTDGSKVTGTYYMEPVTGIGTNTQPIFYLGRVDSD